MASRVLLVSANRCTVPERVFPLGLTQVHTALRQAGHTCGWFDVLAQGPPLEEVIESFQPDFVGISVRNIDDVILRNNETFYQDLIPLCARLRRATQRPLILGGSGFSIFPRELLELSSADFGIAGEGEVTFPTLIRSLERGEPYDQIPGLVFRRGGRVVTNPPCAGAVAHEVSEADRPEAATAHYLNSTGVLNLQTQRGCSFRCCYCTYPLLEGRRHRRRPPELVAAEFTQLQRLGAKYAFIVDSVFNSSTAHVQEVCEAILRAGVKIAWGCFLRPRGLTPELMKLMVRAGLAHVEFGSDSFCDEVLRAYQKDFSFDDIQYSTELAWNENVDFCHFLIAGGPGETMETLQRSYESSVRLRNPVIMAVAGMRIYPETPLHRRALDEGVIEPDTDLLTPCYYLAPNLNAETLLSQLKQLAQRSPNWVVGDPGPAYFKLVEKLRKRGVVGPLWSYFSAIQRLWPQEAPDSAMV
jgi:radical SAM superfamily enzyme YgiQ (UPF0313 family)